MSSRRAFYCMSSRLYFLGAVGLVNSLRLLGHDEPVRLLDCGLTDRQRELLAAEAEVVAAPDDREPFMLKTVLPCRHPAEAMALLDADMVAVRRLDELFERATTDAGGVVAVAHPRDRFVAEWGELLGRGEARRRPYVSSALVVLGGERGWEVLRILDGAMDRIDFERTMFRTKLPSYPFIGPGEGDAAAPDDPFFLADQDLLNAVLATTVPPAEELALDPRLAPLPPFAGLRLRDERTLACAYRDGVSPYVVHHHTTKPWLERTYHGIYSRLLRRLLIGPGVAIRVPEEELPLWLRRGPRAFVARTGVNARERIRWHVREPLGARLRRRRERRR